MTARIDVRPLTAERFEVTIEEGGSKTRHEVTATNDQVAKLADGTAPADLVEASIRFLLDRESKESIMSSFDLDVITRFFPEYQSGVHDYL